MRKRQSIKKSRSKRLFKKTSGVHRKNVDRAVMRGGYRL
jgi:hypothetical protein